MEIQTKVVIKIFSSNYQPSLKCRDLNPQPHCLQTLINFDLEEKDVYHGAEPNCRVSPIKYKMTGKEPIALSVNKVV